MAQEALVAPAPEVEQSPIDQSLDDRIAEKFGLADDGAAEAAPAAEAPEKPEVPEGDELAPEEIGEEAEGAEAPAAADELELVRHGKTVKVSREEAIQLAQQGYDYAARNAALKEERRQFEQAKKALAVGAQLRPQLIQAAGKVEAINLSLQPYENVDWVQVAQQDPTNYAMHHANYSRLMQQRAQAQEQLQAQWQQYQQTTKELTDEEFSAAARQTLERIPSWSDEQKRKTEQGRIIDFLTREDFTRDELEKWSDPRMVALARKAMLYDEAMRNRQSKQQQIKKTPPVKAGTPPPRVNVQTKKTEVIKQLHQAKDPDRRKALFDEALALKFGLK